MSQPNASLPPNPSPVRARGAIVVAVAILAIGYAVGGLRGDRSRVSIANQLRGESASQRPSPDLQPDDVVRVQLSALASENGDLAGVAQCFAFASPLNRRATGPLDRFAAMIVKPPYRALLTPDQTLIGTPVVQGNQARVLVTLVDADEQLATFEFLLSRQQAPYEGCWMTDAVLQLAAARRQPPDNPRRRSPRTI